MGSDTWRPASGLCFGPDQNSAAVSGRSRRGYPAEALRNTGHTHAPLAELPTGLAARRSPFCDGARTLRITDSPRGRACRA